MMIEFSSLQLVCRPVPHSCQQHYLSRIGLGHLAQTVSQERYLSWILLSHLTETAGQIGRL